MCGHQDYGPDFRPLGVDPEDLVVVQTQPAEEEHDAFAGLDEILEELSRSA
jgi:hypothetical protein